MHPFIIDTHPGSAAGRRRTDSTAAIRLLIGEMSPIICEGLRSMLAGTGVEVAGAAASGDELVERVKALGPDAVLLDVQIPRSAGFSLLETIRAAAPGVAIVLLDMGENPGYLVEAVAHGATCYLSQGVSQSELVAALRAATVGQPAMDQPALAKAVEALARTAREGSARRRALATPLTRRERQVLALVAQGHTNREIATSLAVSMGTVKTHVCNILAKLEVTDRVQAAVWATRQGLGPAGLDGAGPAPCQGGDGQGPGRSQRERGRADDSQ